MIVDAFTFFNEVELIKLRLATLAPVIDRFVIVESTKTHQGAEKDLVFPSLRNEFAHLSAKIVYVVVDDMPSGIDPWERENHQRRCIVRGLHDLTRNDSVLISDVDEIPDPEAIKASSQETYNKVVGFQQQLFYYFTNYACNELSQLPWTLMTKFDENFDAQTLRLMIVAAQAAMLSGGPLPAGIHLMPNAGWHFSFLGGLDRIVRKLESYAHVEFNTSHIKNATTLNSSIQQGKDILGRELTFRKVEITSGNYSPSVAERLMQFPQLIMP
jgi:hypothetical protein